MCSDCKTRFGQSNKVKDHLSGGVCKKSKKKSKQVVLKDQDRLAKKITNSKDAEAIRALMIKYRELLLDFSETQGGERMRELSLTPRAGMLSPMSLC